MLGALNHAVPSVPHPREGHEHHASRYRPCKTLESLLQRTL